MKNITKKDIIRSIKNNKGYYGINGIQQAVKAIEAGDYIIIKNDIVVGLDTFLMPHRYYDAV